MAASPTQYTLMEDTNIEPKPHRRSHAQQHSPDPPAPPARHRLKAKASDRGLAWTFLRALVPVCAVSWADFLLADMLTSLAKPMADLSRATCHLARRDVMAPFDKGCEGMIWFMPFVAAVPFVCRLVQCLRVFRDTGATPQLYNALKYASALPAMWVWGLRGAMDTNAWVAHFQALYVLVAAGTTVFSYFWDVERDWELGYFSAPKGKRPPFPLGAPTLPRELLYTPDFYYYLMFSNLVLRFMWLTRLVPSWAASCVVCCMVSSLEVCRRAQWAFVRVEVELRKLQQQRPELGRLVPAVAPYHVVADGNAGRLWDDESLEALSA